MQISYTILADATFSLDADEVAALIPVMESAISKYFPEADVDVRFQNTTGAGGGAAVSGFDNYYDVVQTVTETVSFILQGADEDKYKAEATTQTGSWYKFTAYNSQAMYGFGTAAEADKYSDFLNLNREINVYGFAEITDEAEAANLDSSGEGVNLADALAEIEDAKGPNKYQARVNACETVDDLCDVLNAIATELADTEDVNAARLGDVVDMASLPTFGGREPSDTSGIFSWDKYDLLVEGDSAYELQDRDDA